jgi:hypothetical protein
MTIEEKNSHIAKFMKSTFHDTANGKTLVKNEKGFVGKLTCCLLHELEYHKDWAWLMPVVKKCIEFEKPNPNEGWSKSERFETHVRVNYFREIDFIYEAVVEFVKWAETLKK